MAFRRLMKTEITLLAGLALLGLAGTAGCRYSSGSSRTSSSSMMHYASYADDAMGADAFNTEDYNHIVENDFVAVADDPRSTFSIDVDTASYTNTRRFLAEGRLPPTDAVRIEELVNDFDYDYPKPQGDDPLSVTSEVAACPWNAKHKLVHLGIQGKTLERETIPKRNLVFLADVSGSMEAESAR